MIRCRGDCEGQASILVLGLALVVLGVSGLAVDGTRAFLTRRSLQSAADGAAMAAAGEIDRAAFYSSDGRRVVLNPQRARALAVSWLHLRGLRARSFVDARPGAVRVVLRTRVATSFLAVLGVQRLTVAAVASATPQPRAGAL